jgi:hypothetical protein
MLGVVCTDTARFIVGDPKLVSYIEDQHIVIQSVETSVPRDNCLACRHAAAFSMPLVPHEGPLLSSDQLALQSQLRSLSRH